MIVGAAVVIGAQHLAAAQSSFFADAKAVREAAGVGSSFVNGNVARHVIEAWLPQFKFLGLGMGLMTITMALGTITKKLRYMGKLAPATPPIPKQVLYFQLSTMMVLIILLGVLVVGIVLATAAVQDYWNAYIANNLNPALPGCFEALATVSSFGAWLNPLRRMGMASPIQA